MMISNNLVDAIEQMIEDINANLLPGRAPITAELWVDNTLKLAMLDYYSRKIRTQKEAEYEEAMSLKRQKNKEAEEVIENKRKQIFTL